MNANEVKQKSIPIPPIEEQQRIVSILDRFDNGVDQTNLKKDDILNILIPIISIAEQQRIVDILGGFDTLTTDITAGLQAEIEARRKQYEYYRDQLLTFKQKA